MSGVTEASRLERGAALSGYQWAILAIAVLAQTAAGSSSMAIPVLASFYQRDLGLSSAQVGLFTGAIAAGTVVSALGAGWVTDAIGVRRMLLIGLTMAGGFIASLSLAPSFSFALPLAFLAGMGSSLSGPAISKSILYWFSIRRRGTAMGIKQTGIPLAGALGAAILPALALAFNWRLAVVALGAAVMTAGFVCFAVYRDSGTIVPEGERKAPSLAGLKGVLVSKKNWLVCGLASVLVGAQFCVVTYLMLNLKDVVLVSAAVAGGYLALVQASGLFARIGWGVFSDIVLGGRRRVVLVSCGFIAMAMIALVGFLGADVPSGLLVALMIGLGVSLIGWHGVWITMMTESSAVEMAGTTVGFGSTLVHIGAMAMPALFGFIVDTTGSYRVAWCVVAATILLGTILLLSLREEKIVDVRTRV